MQLLLQWRRKKQHKWAFQLHNAYNYTANTNVTDVQKVWQLDMQTIMTQVCGQRKPGSRTDIKCFTTS